MGSIELPVLLVNGGTLTPNANLKLPIRSKSNFTMIETCLLGANPFTMIALAYRSDILKTDRKLFDVCTIAAVEKVTCYSNYNTTHYTLQLKGMARGKIINYGSPLSEIRQLYDIEGAFDESLLSEFLSNVMSLYSLAPPSLNRDPLRELITSGERQYGAIVDLAVANIKNVNYESQLQFIAECDVAKRMKQANAWIKEALMSYGAKNDTSMQILKELDGRTETTTSPNSLVRRLEQKKRKLGDVDQLANELQEAGLPHGSVSETISEELERLRSLSNSSQDYHVLYAYLKLVAQLPWSKSTEDACDLQKSKDILEREHSGMADVKKRILEFLAVKQLKNEVNGPILCLCGPPGVGKTSIAKSVAETLGRKFQRIALGGIRDQSTIRGHRRTYVGALPGRIIQSLKLAKSKNPVILLDEIDKLGEGINGDPSSALLEVLDPAQNYCFQDLYLNLPFDLSQVVWIVTANDISRIPSPLKDRMEVIEMSSYSVEQKFKILTNHILPRQLSRHALSPDYLQLSTDAIYSIIESYTFEAGVRELERVVAQVCRWATLKVANAINGGEVNSDTVSAELSLPINVNATDLHSILGKERHSMRNGLVKHASLNTGVALGLAVTPVGGQVLVIEAALYKGKGDMVLTGKLGDVIKESVQVAISWLRSQANVYQYLDFSEFNKFDLHVHMPGGAVAKDGPSAGCAFILALFSLLSGRKVRADSACTGEISLTGKVLAIGGVKEKVLAAHRQGIYRVCLPLENKNDIQDLDSNVVDRMDINFVDTAHQLLEQMMEPESDKLQAKM
ncbi:Lon protease-like protein [Aphelenchoides besseyi]|nr:Lon protease-like protein [Aphelenchoides besseyi]